MIDQPPDGLPEWAKPVLGALFGAGGATWLRAWLENKRLGKKEFREALTERIRELEEVVSSLQLRQANMREELGQLKAENAYLRAQLLERS